MKIRDGFVSNSSSTSFIVVVRNDADEIFKYVLELAALIKQDIVLSTVGALRKKLGGELAKLIRDHTFACMRVETLEKYAADKAFCAKLRVLDQSLCDANGKIEWTAARNLRFAREQESQRGEEGARFRAKNVVVTALAWTRDVKSELETRISDVKAKLARMDEFHGDAKTVSFEQGHWPSGGIKAAIEKMVRDGKAVVVERIDT